ncbi:MAG: hypothetical protein AB2989_03565 [Candidatus Symbiodolus clandestinus]
MPLSLLVYRYSIKLTDAYYEHWKEHAAAINVAHPRLWQLPVSLIPRRQA